MSTRRVSKIASGIGMALLVASISGSALAGSNAPKPLPTGPDGQPDVQAQLAALGPGETVLLGVKAPHGKWYAPSDANVTSQGGQIVSGDLQPKDGGGPSPTASQVNGFGCFVNVYPPGFVYQGAIQGNEDFVSCVSVASTSAQVCLKESRTYGLHVCKTSNHFGNAVWTAWSNAFACETQYHRQWMTTGTNTYIATNGQSSLWGFSSNWGGAFSC